VFWSSDDGSAELGIVEDAVTKFEVCGMFFEVLIGIVDIVRQSTLLCGTCAFVRSNPYAGVALLGDRWTPVLVLVLVLVLNGWRATGCHGGYMVKIMISS